MSLIDPKLPAKAHLFFVVSVSVSSETSAAAAGVGPFAGIFVRASTSFTIVGDNGNSIDINDAPRNAFIWLQGAYLSVIATATAQFGVI